MFIYVLAPVYRLSTNEAVCISPVFESFASHSLAYVIVRRLKCPLPREVAMDICTATPECSDCGVVLVDNAKSRTYRTTDTLTGWCHWTRLCSKCDQRQWNMYRKLEPRPQVLGPGTYSYVEWDEEWRFFADWLVNQLHPRRHPAS